jgi:cysteine desulfurase family protein (TIGR01976 family)
MAYDVTAVRTHFPSLASGVAHFDGPGGTQSPDVVGDAVRAALLAPIANRGRTTQAERNADDIVTAARSAMADLLGADPAGIVFGRSATALTYIVSRALAKRWGSGDEIVVSRLDHDANIRPWIQAAESAGASVRWIDFDPVAAELTTDQVAAVLSERTRLVAVTGASNLIGTRPPVSDIAGLVHARGALLAVDGVHLTAHAGIDVTDLGADLFTCSPYKFCGPHCGVLAGSPALLDTLHPDKLLPSTDAVPERFEFGTLPYELLAGVTAAVDFLAGFEPDAGGSRRGRLLASMAALEAHEDRLRDRLEDGLAALPGITVHSRAERRTPTLLLTFADRAAADAYRFLAERRINAPAGSFYAIEPSRRLGLGEPGGLRIGLAPYTTDDDIDRLLAALAGFLRS